MSKGQNTAMPLNGEEEMGSVGNADGAYGAGPADQGKAQSSSKKIIFAAVGIGLLVVVLAVVVIVVVTTSSSSSSSTELTAAQKDFVNNNPYFHLNGDCHKTKVIGEWKTVEKEKYNSASGTTRVAVFKSIPYAKPPVGSLRFRGPVDVPCPLGSSTTEEQVWNASIEQSSGCPQPGGFQGAEDCLYLVVFVPESVLFNAVFPTDGSATAATTPVVTYIHGGALIWGTSLGEPLGYFSVNTPPPTENSEGGNLVAVVPNYRLGGLGWMAVEAMEEELISEGKGDSDVAGNFGLQDQISALRWINMHISAVGGDPKANTVMGESSGGTSLLAMMTTDAAKTTSNDGLFRAGISLSASPNITMGKSVKYEQDEPFATKVGCPRGNGGAAEQMKCLRNVQVSTFLDEMPNSWTTPGMWSLQTLDHNKPNGLELTGLFFVDGKLMKHSVDEAMATGKTASGTVLMLGNTGQEPNIFYTLNWPNPQAYVLDYTEVEWRTWLEQHVFQSWGAGGGGAKPWLNNTEMADKFIDFYGSAMREVNPVYADYTAQTDYSISCAAPWLAYRGASPSSQRHQENDTPVPVYTFLTNWPPSKPNNATLWGTYAFHEWDYISGIHDWARFAAQNHPEGPYEPSEKDLELSSLLRRHWGALIRDASLESLSNSPSAKAADIWPPAFAKGAPATTGRPTDYYTFVYSREDKFPFMPSQAVKNYKQEECNFFRENGIDEGYWWVN